MDFDDSDDDTRIESSIQELDEAFNTIYNDKEDTKGQKKKENGKMLEEKIEEKNVPGVHQKAIMTLMNEAKKTMTSINTRKNNLIQETLLSWKQVTLKIPKFLDRFI